MNGFSNTLSSNILYNRSQIQWYEKFNRFGTLNPYNRVDFTKEYIFFTKPDCHIFKPMTDELQSVFKSDPFFVEMKNRYPYILHNLQRSSKSPDEDVNNSPFMNILSNGVDNTIDLQGLSAAEMDNNTNVYGTAINYRKDAWTGDEHPEFTLEFTDTKFAEIYNLVRAYEQYERKCTVGVIYPPNIDNAPLSGDANFNRYIKYKELHDTFGVFRFIVDNDYESLIYWSYICGTYFNNVPRDAFNDMNNNGLKLALDFKGFCVKDYPDPLPLILFNKIINESYGTPNISNYIPVYNDNIGGIDGRWAKYPYIVKVSKDDEKWYGSKGMAYKYKFKWYD